MTSHAQHIAVVSMAGIFPGAADTDQLIQNIFAKKESIIQVPPHRWAAPAEKMVTNRIQPDGIRPDRAVSDRAGLITDLDFDAHDLHLDPDIAAALDPVHHLVLAAGRTACRACYMPDDVRKRTGVILAAIALPTDKASAVSWDILCSKKPKNYTAIDTLGASMVSGPAAVLARALDLGAGSFTLDAACASSLYAIKLACEHLNLGKADAMVTGGVSRPDSLYTQIGFSQLSALSPSGRCAPFDRKADGLVVGEGCGIIVLKRLADALACHDPIFGVIKGWGVSNDIGGNLVAPASEGQIRAMSGACDMAGLLPDTIQYMECHGSGTPVGDRVELSSIRDHLDRYGCPGTALAIGSVKSNIGHLLTAAGAAGFIKTLLAMNRKILPPSVNFTALPENSPLDRTRVHVQTKTSPWDPPAPGVPRRAAVSAFGFGGINAHILVEEFYPSGSRHIMPGMVPPSPIDAKKNDAKKSVLSGFAIVGMGSFTRDCRDLDAFTDLILGQTRPQPAPAFTRWRRTDHLSDSLKTLPAGFLDTISIDMKEFHIPPVQMTEILPQHLVLLKAAKSALADAGIQPRPGENDPLRTNIGCATGIAFDFGATDFSLRWKAHGLADNLLDQLSPPLTFTRTLGALGGIAASRVAREFKLGGPCFTVSAGAASGIKALETGIHSLENRETDLFICGCVDMAGDIRQFLLHHGADPFGPARPAEGACAVVIKRLEDAQKDNDRIYAIIEGISGGSAGSLAAEAASDPGAATETTPDRSSGTSPDAQPDAPFDAPFDISPDTSFDTSSAISFDKALDSSYRDALHRLLADNHIHFSDICFMDTHSGGHGTGAAAEARALDQTGIAANQIDCTLGWTSGVAGDTRGASGLFSVIKTALCLFHRTIPACALAPDSLFHPLKKNGFFIPGTAMDWKKPKSGPGRAVTAAMTDDGCTAFCLLRQGPDQIPATGSKSFEPPFPRDCDPAEPMPGTNPTGNSGASPKRSHPKSLVISTTLPALTDDLVNALELVNSREKANTLESLHSVEQENTIEQGNQKTLLRTSPAPTFPMEPIMDPELVIETSAATARAHETFLAFSRTNMQEMQTQLTALAAAAATAAKTTKTTTTAAAAEAQATAAQAQGTVQHTGNSTQPDTVPPVFTRDQCLEFAVGRAGSVLGPAFAVIDTYPVRVRLPDEPLMLVDRIMHMEGTPCSLGPGKIITQHDVLPGAWYLDGGVAPVSICIEAGQADLFLCAWLGIDHQVKGKRRYRLLDAKVTFHRSLPVPGETIEYHICIDRFLRQGDVYLFFFHYTGYLDEHLFISMRDGCAGFFTEDEVKNSGGIVLKKDDVLPAQPCAPFQPLVRAYPTAFDDRQVDSLRKGDLEAAFGPEFAGMFLGKAQHLPGGPMHLIDRVLSFDPRGGRFGMGLIVAEADIDPDAWFLTCHFIDDPVMPGTLMYECCAHALRIFVQRMGWISLDNRVHFSVLPDNESDLKCRGPVTPATKKARYEIEIQQIGYNPVPYVVADAHMFADDLRIVLYKNMGLTLSGVSRDALNRFWRQQ